ncbi:radical SAM protein [bacterium]|nr:radical SAM protein [bacterium]
MLLIHPWIVDFAAYDFWIKPLGLLYLASKLRRTGYHVTLLDCLDRLHPFMRQCSPSDKSRHRFFGTGYYPKEILSKPPLLKNVPRRYGRYGLPMACVRNVLSTLEAPQIIFITSGMTYWYPGVFDMIALCKTLFPEAPVILGGIYATLCPEHARSKSGADYVLPGPSIPDALRLAETITGFKCFKDTKASIRPAYDLYKVIDTAAIRTGIGCPFRCPFCASHILSSEFSRRNPEDVFQEIRHLNLEMNIGDIAFYDDALLLDQEKHIVPILNKVIDSDVNVRLHTPNGLHPRWINRQLAGLMFQSGFQTLRLSYESINPERQKAMGMKVTDSDLKKAVHHLKSSGFTSREIGGYILMGLPDQTLEEVIESIFFVFSLGIRVSLASFSPIPGTESWKTAAAQGLIDWNMDPLLTNNSILPMVPDPQQKWKLIQIKTLCAQANQMVIRGESPLQNAEWRRQIRVLSSESAY